MQTTPTHPQQSPNLLWLIPSFHGDISLEMEGKDKTLLRVYQLTAAEEKAMELLRSRAVSPKRLQGKPWAKSADFLALTNSAYRTNEGVTVHLKAPIADVKKILAKALKPERTLLTAVKFSNGHIEEVHAVKTQEGVKEVIPEKPKEEPQPVVATTVARPVNGCPMPNFPEADVRASRVLETFLNPDQIADYRKTGSFITVGADTAHRYLICNRERPNFMNKYLGGRQLYDMEDKRPICVHDWAVPPPEEMLALHLCLSMPGREVELLHLPEVRPEDAFRDVNPAYIPNQNNIYIGRM
jgi:hypothetical protein